MKTKLLGTCTLGYNDFDFFDKMGPPRPVDVNWDSRTHLGFFLAVSSALAQSATISNKFFLKFHVDTIKCKMQCGARFRWKKWIKSYRPKTFALSNKSQKLDLSVTFWDSYCLFGECFFIILALFTNFECKRGRNGSIKTEKLFLINVS